MTTHGSAAPSRRPSGTASRKAAAVAACALATLASCTVLDDASGPCPKSSTTVRAGDLHGDYQGPHGMRVTLGRASTQYPEGRTAQVGTVRVRNWALSLEELDENGPAGKGFRGEGTWEFRKEETTGGERFRQIKLDFLRGTPEQRVPTDPQYLEIGGTRSKPELFVESDPDTCPDVVFHR
ncbi:hypothetical protein MMF93_00355 [Streptomyces tubbatahanensis]|uniref:Lipoprotein n=1 Tax=Streptomyces tubbatahanensis TaxID=2923272 RepID=A0ABY3XL05_9ACTN|nr:hypothetical protein [Streptomyces tubbatahanensis]UNS95084.1 hypothetical protein MMF93_00355 [Streptomyces tubbatahanensis]